MTTYLMPPSETSRAYMRRARELASQASEIWKTVDQYNARVERFLRRADSLLNEAEIDILIEDYHDAISKAAKAIKILRATPIQFTEVQPDLAPYLGSVGDTQ